jgi:hypothetical protein
MHRYRVTERRGQNGRNEDKAGGRDKEKKKEVVEG